MTADDIGQGPDLAGFGRFLAALGTSFPEKSYRWTRAKERSCDWLIERIPAGTVGVDIGGTEYLCQRLSDNGCDITYYDFVAPKSFPTFIQDDMFNVLRHFDPASLDFIVTRHTLEHSVIPLFQLWAYNQLLADDGTLLVTVPCYHDRWIWMTTHFHCVPPESWQMLFHRAGFGIREFETGTWKPRNAEFIEHRFVLEVQSRELRLTGRPERVLVSPPSALAAADPDRGPRGTSKQERAGDAEVHPGRSTWVQPRRPWWRRQ